MATYTAFTNRTSSLSQIFLTCRKLHQRTDFTNSRTVTESTKCCYIKSSPTSFSIHTRGNIFNNLPQNSTDFRGLLLLLSVLNSFDLVIICFIKTRVKNAQPWSLEGEGALVIIREYDFSFRPPTLNVVSIASLLFKIQFRWTPLPSNKQIVALHQTISLQSDTKYASYGGINQALTFFCQTESIFTHKKALQAQTKAVFSWNLRI